MKNKNLSFVGMRLKGRCINDPETTRKSRGNHPVITPLWKVMTMIMLLLTMGIGQMWGANGDVLFSQDFNGATAVSQSLKTKGTNFTITTSSGNNIFGNTASSQFTSLKAQNTNSSDNDRAGLAINSSVTVNGTAYNYTGKFGFYSNNTYFPFHLVKTTNFATTAPTALKVAMKMYYKQLSSGTNVTVSFAIGDSFSESSKPANSNIHSGFTIKGNNTAKFCQFGTTTDLTGYTTAMTQDSYVDVVWVINNTEEELTYKNPSGDDETVAKDKFDIWVGTTKCVNDAPATTATKTLQNLYIGDCDAKKKYEFRLDSIVVTDLTPAPATTYSVTYSAGDGSVKSGKSLPTQAAVVAGTEITLASAEDLEKEGKEFDGWLCNINSTKYAEGAKYTMTAAATTFTAQWKDAGALSSDATLSALSVTGCTLNETFAPATTAYTISLPFYASMPAVSDVTATKNDTKAKTPEVSISGNVITVVGKAEDNTTTKTYTITVNIADAPAASSSINIEQLVLDNSTKYNIGAALDAAHISYVNKDALDSLKNQDGRNEPYLGLKFKKNTSSVTIIVPDGQYLKVKFGYVDSNAGLKVSVNGATAAAPSLIDGVYTLPASAGIKQVVFTQPGTDKRTVVYKQIKINEEISAVTLPWLVTYDAGEHGTCATTKAVWTGTALTLPEVTPESNWDFDGWYDGETKVSSPYNPGKNANLVAHYTAQAAGTDLDALTYQIGTGAETAVGYTAGYYTYTIELPYKSSYDAITVNVTPVTGASVKDDETKVLTVSSLPGVATFTVTDGVSEQLYTVNFKKAAKDGVSIIKATTNNVVTGYVGGTRDTNLDNGTSKKLNAGKYFGVQLTEGNFQENDVLVVNITAAADLGKFMVYADAARETLIADQGITYTKDNVENPVICPTGRMSLVLPAAVNGHNTLYLSRDDNNTQWNVTFSYIEVLRAMDPVLTAISINGEACEKGTGNAFSVTLPEAGTNLASLTVVPTIVRNAAHATTPEAVVSNEGAWVEGVNTYRVMDKDGDYTDYTITITLQGEAETPVISAQPATQAYCAGNEPTLTVEASVTDGGTLHYAWFKDDAAFGTDAATCTVDGVGTYKVVVTNKVDGKLDASATSNEAIITLNTSAAITTQPSDLKKQTEGDNITLSVVASNATGYQWYSCDDKDKTNPALISGAESANYQFAAAAGFYYCVVTGACNEVESNVAEVTVKRSAGCQYITATSGSQATLTDGTILYACGSDGKTSTDGIFTAASSDVTAVDEDAVGEFNKQYIIAKFPVDVEEITIYGTNGSDRAIDKIRVKSTIGPNSADKFDDNTAVSATKTASRVDKDITVTAVLEAPISKDDYANIVFTGGSMRVYRICYTEALPKPVLPTLNNQEYCAGGSFVAWNAETSVTEGTLSYQWYDADADEPIEGATNPTYTPTANGHYYVKVTNAAAGRVSRVTQSSTLSAMIYDAMTITTAPVDVTTQAGVAASLSVEAEGNGLSYAWYTCDANGDNAVALDPAVTTAELNVTAQLGVQYYKVVVTDDCDAELSAVATVEGIATLPLVAINGSYTWDFTKASAAQIKLDGNTAVKKDEEAVMINIPGVEMDQSKFKSQALKFSGEYIHRTDDGTKYPACATTIKFETTVPGKVTVVFADNGGNNRCLSINGNISGASSSKTDYKTYSAVVPAGEVVLTGYKDNEGGKYIRFFSIDFTAREDMNPAEADYTRSVTEGRYGTICLPKAGVMVGAAIFEVAYRDEADAYKKIFCDEVLSGEMVAGRPYIFLPREGATQLGVFYTDETQAEAGNYHGLYGSYTEEVLGTDGENYILLNNQYRQVINANTKVGANRGYFKIGVTGGVPTNEVAPAPGRRRVALGYSGTNAATDINNLNAGEQPMKIMIDGQIFILRGEKMYDITGKLVK